MQFTKLFNSILDSTIWQEPLETKVTWITMLAMADRNGEVHASIPGLAKRAGVTIPQCEAALACLASPDPYSRTKDNEGRRIEAIDGGWTLLNHGKYRALLSKEERREYNRRKQAEYRARRKNVNDMSITVNHSEQNAHSTEAEAEAEAEATIIHMHAKQSKPSKRKGTLDEIVAYCLDRGLTKKDGHWLFDKWGGNGWTNNGKPIKCWQATIRSWKTAGYFPSQRATEQQNDRHKRGII
jgi:hypothetical protein